MKNVKRIMALLMAGCVLLSGCGGKGKEAETETNTGENKQVEDGKIEVNAARPIPDDLSFPSGDTLEDNIWTRLYEEELGVKLNYIWMSPVSQYDQKLNISITSGDLPDVFQVNATQLKQLVDDGQLMDLTDIYEQTASDYTKDVMGQDGGNALLSATFDEKLMAIPKMSSGIGNANVLWLRSDWLEALGLEEPKTMEDVLAIARAFTNEDPDGNGQDDTFGLALNKDLWGMFASLEGFFNGYGAYPNAWIEGDGGKLENGNVQPEMKEALQALQDL